MKLIKSPSILLQRFIKLSAAVWILSIVVFVFTIASATKGFVGVVQNTQFGNSGLFLVLMLGSMGIGSLAFGLLVLAIVINIALEKKVLRFEKSLKGIFIFGIKLCILLAILPLFLLYRVSGLSGLLQKFRKEGLKLIIFKPKAIKPFIVRLIAIIAISLTFLPLWIGGYWVVGAITAQQLGYVTQPISVGGTGSMYPTFPKGHGKTLQEQAKEVVGTSGMLPYPNGLVLFGRRVLGHQVGRGDIVVVENGTVREYNKKLLGEPSGWVKRVVAIAGDNVELKDGIVYLNGNSLKEPYIAKAHSTFGETFLKECSKVTVPENSVFIMGDNRKGSGDSREVGFFSINDIKYVLPLKSQKGDLIKYWRDTSKDFDESSKIRLDKEKYVELLNEKRKEANVRPLKYQSKLELSAGKRGEVILKHDDFSYEATRSGYTQLKAMNDAGYSNITYGEAPRLGYYEADELIENQFEFPETKKFLLNNDYQEIGISEVEGSLNKCPAQVIVQHFAGYVPPNYKKGDIESWKTSLSKLREIQPSWERLKTYQQFYDKNKQNVDRINTIISQRISNINAIVARMEANQWLTVEEQKMIVQDKPLYDEQETIATRLNSR